MLFKNLIENGDLISLQGFQNSALLTFRDNDGKNLLHLAVIHKQAEIVQHLLSIGFDVNSRDSHGLTSLHHAIFSLNGIDKQIVELLINNKATFENEIFLLAFLGKISETTHFPDSSFIATDSLDMGPIFYAVANNQEQTLLFLLQKQQSHKEFNKFGVGLLHLAAANGYKNLIPILVNANSVNHKDHSGNTPLHYAIKNNQVDSCVILLKQDCVDISVPNNAGETQFELASQSNNDNLRSVFEKAKIEKLTHLGKNIKGINNYSNINQLLQHEHMHNHKQKKSSVESYNNVFNSNQQTSGLRSDLNSALAYRTQSTNNFTILSLDKDKKFTFRSAAKPTIFYMINVTDETADIKPIINEGEDCQSIMNANFTKIDSLMDDNNSMTKPNLS